MGGTPRRQLFEYSHWKQGIQDIMTRPGWDSTSLHNVNCAWVEAFVEGMLSRTEGQPHEVSKQDLTTRASILTNGYKTRFMNEHPHLCQYERAARSRGA